MLSLYEVWIRRLPDASIFSFSLSSSRVFLMHKFYLRYYFIAPYNAITRHSSTNSSHYAFTVLLPPHFLSFLWRERRKLCNTLFKLKLIIFHWQTDANPPVIPWYAPTYGGLPKTLVRIKLCYIENSN